MHLSQNVEAEDAQQKLQEKKRIKKRLKPQVLNCKRFESADFTQSRLNLPLKTFLEGYLFICFLFNYK